MHNRSSLRRSEGKVVEVHGLAFIIDATNSGCDAGANVAALGDVCVEAKGFHELIEGLGGLGEGELFGRYVAPSGEAKVRDGWGDDVVGESFSGVVGCEELENRDEIQP